MRLITLPLIFLLFLGCKSIVTIQPDPEAPPVMVVETVTYGRSCVAVDYKVHGDMSFIVDQDGTSDWVLGRLFGWLGDVAGGTPFGGSQQRSSSGMADPSAIQGCGFLFVDEFSDESSED
jgi:hypothetical protein